MSEMVLTNNFYNFVRTVLLSSQNNQTTPSNSSEGWYGNVSVINSLVATDSTLWTNINVDSSSRSYVYKSASLNLFNIATSGTYATSIKIGSGGTAPTVNDLNIEVPINASDASISLQSLTMGGNTPKLSFLTTIYAINDIVVKEIGMTKTLKCGSATASAFDKTFLFGRCVLDTPISLSAGESTTITVSIAF